MVSGESEVRGESEVPGMFLPLSDQRLASDRLSVTAVVRLLL
jgi:hypothetical protein